LHHGLLRTAADMKRARAHLAGALSSIGAVALAFTVRAAEPAAARLHLEYRRDHSARGCLSPEQLQDAVEARLGRRVFVATREADLRARVSAARRGGRWSLEIALFDRTGQSLGRRELSTRARHCSALDDSAALVLALAADMPGLARATPVEETAAPEPAPRPVSPPVQIIRASSRSLETPLEIPESTHTPRSGLQLEPALGVVAVSGLLPRVGYGLELGITLRSNAFWPVSVRAAGWLGQRRELEGARAATFSLRTLEVGVCPWTGPFGGSSLSVCAVEWLGWGRARGIGFDQTEESNTWLLQFGPGLSLTQGLGPLLVSASATALVPAVRRRYFFTEAGADDRNITVYGQSWLSLSAALRVGIEI
jgi:hypothetical protein